MKVMLISGKILIQFTHHILDFKYAFTLKTHFLLICKLEESRILFIWNHRGLFSLLGIKSVIISMKILFLTQFRNWRIFLLQFRNWWSSFDLSAGSQNRTTDCYSSSCQLEIPGTAVDSQHFSWGYVYFFIIRNSKDMENSLKPYSYRKWKCTFPGVGNFKTMSPLLAYCKAKSFGFRVRN